MCFSVLALSLAACASGAAVSPRGSDGGGRDGNSDRSDAEPGVCDPLCEVGETCVAGSCVPSTDADGDGIDASVDCDDDDPRTGSFAERDCEGACGPGLQRCQDGVWGACDAPSSCDCELGAPPRTVPCGRCGTQRQVCAAGSWTNDGDCMGAGECSPGDIDTGGSCGNCGTARRTCSDACTWTGFACEGEGVCAAGAVETDAQACGCGTQTRTRTCSASCTWGAFGAFGACSGGGSCTAGATETRTVACGNCGTQTQTRTCGAGCEWGGWTNSGSCTGQGACAPGATDECSPIDSCGQRVCTASCTWSACQPIVPGGCLRRRSATQPDGSNYRCCTLTATDEGWQFCLPTCRWSTACDPTTSC